jgi:hypothetical protein
VNIKCFYAEGTCLGSNYRNISSLTLVQKVIPGYLQRSVDNYSRAYLWLISHDLSHGVPLVSRKFVASVSNKKEFPQRSSVQLDWILENHDGLLAYIPLLTNSQDICKDVPLRRYSCACFAPG